MCQGFTKWRTGAAIGNELQSKEAIEGSNRRKQARNQKLLIPPQDGAIMHAQMSNMPNLKLGTPQASGKQMKRRIR